MDIWSALQSIATEHACRLHRTYIFTDGGGPSVISQLIIVDEIMHQIKWTLNLDEIPKPCDYADLMVGTGLGA